jgi:hypothetical protein|tara:strand:- start:51 stop:497 length:447 start_codon:yes stop_codon:yes gene_type:complete
MASQKYEKRKDRVVNIQSSTDGRGSGDITFIGTGTTVAGKVYTMKQGEEGGVVWYATDNNATGYYEGLLAVAMGTNPAVDGMLLNGAVTMFDAIDVAGASVYLSPTAGRVVTTRPSQSGEAVRIIGYGIEENGDCIYFSPDNTFILNA